MHHILDRHRTARIAQCVASGAIGLALWAASDVARLERYALVAALAAGVLEVAYLLGLVPYWNRVLAYARAA